MNQVYKVDKQGYYLEPVIVESSEHHFITTPPGEELYLPKWNGATWIEGLTQSEIDQIANIQVEPTETEKLKKQQADLVFTLMMNGVI